MTMPDGHASTPHFYAAIERAARELAPLRSHDDGQKSTYRDPREHPLVQGTPRDAEEALAAAVDSGAIGLGRRANRRLLRLAPDLQDVGRWLSTRDDLGGAEVVVRLTDEGPLVMREEAAAAASARAHAKTVLDCVKSIFRAKCTDANARLVDAANAAAGSASARDARARAALDAWARARLTAFLLAWEATSDSNDDDGEG